MEKNESTRNYLKTILFQGPERIPCTVSIMPATWRRYGEEVEAIVLEHPRLFPWYRAGGFRDMRLARNYQKGRWTDVWGVVWENIEEGLDSIPVEHEAPLRDWSALDGFRAPDPLAVDDLFGNPVDWAARARNLQAAKEHGGLAGGGVSHGFMFMRLFYLRGFNNFMMDVATRDPRLDHVVALVRDYNVRVVSEWLKAGIEILHAGDDNGMQTSLPMSPADWRRILKPCYEAIYGPCRDRGVTVYMHTDGHILDIIPDLVECGVRVINPQIRANGLEGLQRVAKGKVCINLDLDRQLFPFATPEGCREHILQALDALYLPEGGLMLHGECEPDVPLANIRAICETLEGIMEGRVPSR